MARRRQHSKRRDPQRGRQTAEDFELTTAVLAMYLDTATGEDVLVDLETGEERRERA